jgi:hypothetical protein
MTPNQLLGEILHQELVDQDVEKSQSLKMNKSLALNASSSEVVEVKPKTSKTKNEDTSEEGSTEEEITFAIRKYVLALDTFALSSRRQGCRRSTAPRSTWMLLWHASSKPTTHPRLKHPWPTSGSP